jgi:hypothetical protein
MNPLNNTVFCCVILIICNTNVMIFSSIQFNFITVIPNTL